jgi:DNA ligase-1
MPKTNIKDARKLLRPMLAADATDRLERVTLPLYASVKIDGIRATVRDGVVYSRSGKKIPNKQLQAIYGQAKYNGLDGELIVPGVPGDTAFRVTSSRVMSRDTDVADVRFAVFDYVGEGTYDERCTKLFAFSTDPLIQPVVQVLCETVEEILKFEKSALAAGYEGVILRAPKGHYKHGRSTFKEGLLLKLKRFTDEEGEILSFHEQMANLNEATVDELGFTKRSSKKEGKLPLGQLGYLRVKSLKTGAEFEVGTGFTEAERREIWENKRKYKKKIVKFKYFNYGNYSKPRSPVFLGFRDKRDM